MQTLRTVEEPDPKRESGCLQLEARKRSLNRLRCKAPLCGGVSLRQVSFPIVTRNPRLKDEGLDGEWAGQP